MSAEVSVLTELLPALSALERLLPCVLSEMITNVGALLEYLITASIIALEQDLEPPGGRVVLLQLHMHLVRDAFEVLVHLVVRQVLDAMLLAVFFVFLVHDLLMLLFPINVLLALHH